MTTTRSSPIDWGSMRLSTMLTDLPERFSDLSRALKLDGYDKYVEDVWAYDPAEHGSMPELGYLAVKIAEEAGEIAGKIAKAYCCNHGVVENRLGLLLELGDLLYFLAKLSHLFGASVAMVGHMNIEKLDDRRARGTMRGEGDHR